MKDTVTVNPTTGSALQNYVYSNLHEIDSAIERGHTQFMQWRHTPFAERSKLVLVLADLLEQNIDDLAHLMAIEMGKPITQGSAEIEKCIWLCKYYAEHAQEYLADRIIATEMTKAKVCHRPMGIILGIMPWNFPFWQVLRFAVPTIMAGNTIILKHAANALGAGNRIQELFMDAGFAEGVFQHLVLNTEGVASLIEHPHLMGVTLTGSEQAGAAVAAQAGKNLKKSMLELGGSEPYVVLADADVELAASCIVQSRLNNSGQVCIAAKRVIVESTLVDKLVNCIKKHMEQVVVGNPLNSETDLGPLAREDLRKSVHEQVEKSRKQGAKLLLGGIIPDGQGFFYPPTLLVDVKPGMPAFDDEIFGPVVAVITAETEDDAIHLANQSQYGLGAAVFTQDVTKGEHIATYEIDAGVCFVNAMVASDPRLPFGGIKRSGYGRELSKEGILEFVNTKTVAINSSN